MPDVLLVIGTILFGFAAACVLTGLVRGYAERTRMVDSPNDRTLHHGEVPRGGAAWEPPRAILSARGQPPSFERQ